MFPPVFDKFLVGVVSVILVVYGVSRATPLPQNASNINFLLLLLLDLLPRRGLFCLLAVQIALEPLLRARSAWLVVYRCGNLALGWCGHLLAVVLVAPAYIFVGQALGFFARGCAADAPCY